MGMETKEEDIVEDLFIASTHSYLLFFTNQGKVHWLKVHEIPEGGRAGRGKALDEPPAIGRGGACRGAGRVRDFSLGAYSSSPLARAR